LNISMVRYLRRHLVCTVHCLHEQEWWLLMRWSCGKKLIDIWFLTKSSLLALTEWLGRWYEAVSPVTCPDVLLPHRRAGWLHWGKAESIQLCDFADGSKVLKRSSAYHSSDVFTVIRAGSWSPRALRLGSDCRPLVKHLQYWYYFSSFIALFLWFCIC